MSAMNDRTSSSPIRNPIGAFILVQKRAAIPVNAIVKLNKGKRS